MEPELITSKFGFVENAEIVNSRAAMVGVPLAMSFLHSRASPPWGRTDVSRAEQQICGLKASCVRESRLAYRKANLT